MEGQTEKKIPAEIQKKMQSENGKQQNRRSSAQLFFCYLREKSPWLVLTMLIILVYFVVAGLYGYDKSVRNMLYAVRISVFFVLIFVLYDLPAYCRRCRQLETAWLSEGESDYHLPVPKGLTDILYNEIVKKAEWENRRLISELDGKAADMADYYTMWIHQIKTPIAALKLLQQGMREETGAEEKENLKQAAEELFKIEQYAEMALHYARLDSLSADMLLKKYDISVIIRRAVKKYGVLFIGSGLSFALEDFDCEAVTDEKWLGFVVEQLLANALKYTGTGGIRIYGADRSGRECRGTVEYVAIEDTGIGIRPEDLPRIFERGFTGYNGRMDKKSTGIGLYLSRRIMDSLGHDIHVQSEEGKGTKMILGFPRHPQLLNSQCQNWTVLL